MRSRFASLFALAGLLAATAPLASADAQPACAGAAGGGEWRSYGHDVRNSRSQPDEKSISPENVRDLQPLWRFRTAANVPAGTSGGSFSNTPVVADGCVFLASQSGWVWAVNADTGVNVWRRKLPGTPSGFLVGGQIVGSPTVVDGVVYVGVSNAAQYKEGVYQSGGPYVAALDEFSGEVLWTQTVDTEPYTFINSGPVVHDGLLLQGISGYEARSDPRGAYAILDISKDIPAGQNRVLVHEWTISDAEYEKGYRGASIWCTPAIDEATGYAYACGGNPASKKLEHRYSNALLKIDMRRSRSTFGQIVDAYKGNVDQYFPGADRQPACELFGDQITYAAWSAACLQLDIDFGSSPNLFVDSEGRTILGGFQKSGIYHSVFTDNMQMAWTALLSAPCFACNASSPAFDDGRIYVAATPGAMLWGITKDYGKYRWTSPIGGGTHFQSVSTANGVVYTVDNTSTLHATDAATGVPLLKRSFTADTGAFVFDAGSAGVAIARNTIYAASGEWIIAYRIPGQHDHHAQNT